MSRKKRQASEDIDNAIIDNGFVTACEARFVALEVGGGAILVWACPQGVPAPSEEELDEICRALASKELVGTCSSPSGLVVEASSPDLPSTT